MKVSLTARLVARVACEVRGAEGGRLRRLRDGVRQRRCGFWVTVIRQR